MTYASDILIPEWALSNLAIDRDFFVPELPGYVVADGPLLCHHHPDELPGDFKLICHRLLSRGGYHFAEYVYRFHDFIMHSARPNATNMLTEATGVWHSASTETGESNEN